MQQYTENEIMSYSDNILSAGDFVIGNYYSWYNYWYPQYYPAYINIPEKSKIEQAFKIVEKLMKHKIIEKELTVKEFIKIVDEIANIL